MLARLSNIEFLVVHVQILPFTVEKDTFSIKSSFVSTAIPHRQYRAALVPIPRA